jgi:hypothetical protein
MKKHLLVVIALIALVGFSPVNTQAQTGFNTVIEYCTGTWCQWCPCGHDIINGILQAYPNTMVLAYHGAGSDPWKDYSLPMIQAFGMNSYPTGVVGRRTGIISRGGWPNPVSIQSNTVQPGVSIVINNKQYNSGTRTLTANVVLTALENLSGTYYVNFILTEDNIVYPQTGNGSCTGSSSYVHHHVVKDLINGQQGTLLNTTDNWTQGQQVTVPINYVLPSTGNQNVVPENSIINVLVYKSGGAISTDQHVQQTKFEHVINPVGINPQTGVATTYSLEQNYPNPFNPTTNIKFSVPKDGNVSLKFYDMMGREVASYIDNGFLKAGIYNALFDGANLSSGVYFYTLSTNDFTETKKMMLVK